MGKLFAFGAYGFQAVAALSLVMAVARILPAHDYALYSLVMATAQFAAILAFEWIRIAATRFYPGDGEASARRQQATLMVEFVLCGAGLGLTAAVWALIHGMSPSLIGLGYCIAAFQGVTDLQLTLVRFRGDLTKFSRLQTMRAALLLAGAVAGALLTRHVVGALGGIVLAYLAVIAIARFIDASLRTPTLRAFAREACKAHVLYGAPAAGASILHLLTPLALRYAVAGIGGLQTSAGALLAFDLLQRPFVVVVAALYGVYYPPVVAAFDRGQRLAIVSAMRRFYEFTIMSVLLLAGGVLAFLPDVARIIIRPPLQPDFLAAAPLAAIFFASRSILQNTLATAAHLTRRVDHLMGNAVADIAFVSLGAWAGDRFFAHGLQPMLVGATLGAMLALGFGARTPLLLKCPFPVIAVFTSAAAAAGMWAMGLIWTQSIIPDLEIKFLPVVALTILGLAGADISRQFFKRIVKQDHRSSSAP